MYPKDTIEIEKTEEEAEEERRTHTISLDTKVVTWDAVESFNRLTTKEKLYAHYMSKAAWYGSLIIPVQTSPESPIIFSLLHDLFKSNTIEGVKEVAVDYCFYWEEDWQELLTYTCGIFSNCGNYLGYGDTKFIPGVSLFKMNALMTHERIRFVGQELSAHEKWELVKKKIYSLEKDEKHLGLGGEGVTSYYTPNCTEKDLELVKLFLTSYNIHAMNTRVFKFCPNPKPTFIEHTLKTDPPILFEIRTASVDGDFGFGSAPRFDFEGVEFILTSGDYFPQLKDIRFWLGQAQEFCSNEHEKNMLQEYINSFFSGSIDEHKEGSRHFVQNKLPTVESYIGFMETYRDPTVIRAEFQGFVFITDRILSDKFDDLLKDASKFLSTLPWPSEFERDVFVGPNFTAQDVLTFASSGIFSSINVPIYADVRHKVGFKNLSMRKVHAALFADSPKPFLSSKDEKLHSEYFTRARDVQVGLHELLGHGSGKLLIRNQDGTTNFPADLLNPLTNSFIESVYEAGETYDSLFMALGDSMEECRAECVGLFLSLNDEVLKIFGFEGEEAENVKYVNWLECVHTGMALCLKSYIPKAKYWKQSHDQAKFGILRHLIDAGEGLVKIEEIVDEDDNEELFLSLDRSKINTVGKKAIAELLLKTQVFKATADVQSAQRLYRKITAVSNEGAYPWLRWREIILRKLEPPRFCVQPNTFLTDNGTNVKILTYDATFEGLVQSWLDRFDDNTDDQGPSLYAQMDYCWRKDYKHFFETQP